MRVHEYKYALSHPASKTNLSTINTTTNFTLSPNRSNHTSNFTTAERTTTKMSTPTDPRPTFFLNLPTTSLPTATTFYTTLGFTPVPAWNDDSTSVLLLPAPNQSVCLMLHTHSRFAQFTRRGTAIADPRAAQQALFSIMCKDKEGVDGWLGRAEGAGGKRDPYVMEGFGEGMGMYVRSWEDLDGHVWEGVCLLAGVGGGAGEQGKVE
ncbi:uncharacterized protein B0H64DRAFT_45654 [Chaetomium fimeti]|uniref:VOC domain-containing protein n=1 Tax=Chaetomium fimeti TaxID=1854472 RepID=A0AAE0H7B0_9PEZI|nr:hypothetical protein B0H64DRAFT_45654 [Chaetomium fimeti]